MPQYEAEDELPSEDELGLGEEAAGDEAAAEETVEQAAEHSSEAPEIEGFNGQTYESDPFTFDFTSLTADSPASGPQGGNPMAGVFQRLWLHKRNGGIVELYLKGGEVIAPEWFSPRQSQETYGMFAFAERDGSFTMTAVHWDSIERIAVRNVETLPQGMFDEES